ncbi:MULTISPECIES: hypothetical protein [Paenibacillus]|jgi:hypothetical protein|uniref:Uncharacterized protein n=1 Tax=Paenibacillus odorifer TaxID=189426 RepID=A0A1R0XAG4_9BACL|nr:MULTISPECIES: hypothetical protein [Paenibacillus]AIQ72408.1 hypothetical protein PODO_03475 [Paenibacillus odorifer]ETT53916.1 hypothetical protein C171_20704 [Paenibacillus sp. FSL H8-237]OMD26974.1 hypothetical protein BJP48_21425 [Paenibacillus odorifer]OMD31932.1 hypothetical protein BJP51_16930 [Paenibacillus odorifer]OME20402.1 hypothetical protein BSK57_22425 [Paenibacillus odorifer]
MGKIQKNINQNNFNEKTNFNGPTQIAAGDIINNIQNTNHQEAKYTPEPTWRSPFTMAVLTWISFAIAIGGVLPIGIKIVKSGLNVFNGTLKASVGFESQTYLIIFVILIILFVVFLSLRRIAKSQTRYPLFFNFAISGYGKRLTLEKIHIDKCPQCGGKMKYYNKPVEWREVQYSDGRRKRETTKRVPALECKRNSEHCYRVDPAEDMLL